MPLSTPEADRPHIAHPRTANQKWRDAEAERQKVEADEDGYGAGIALAFLCALPAYVLLAFLASRMGWL